MSPTGYAPCSPIVAVGLFLTTACLWLGWGLTHALTLSPFGEPTWWLMAWFPALLGVGYAGFISMLPPVPGRAARVLFLILTGGSFALGWAVHKSPLSLWVAALQIAAILVMLLDTFRPAGVPPVEEPVRSSGFWGIPLVCWLMAVPGFALLGLELYKLSLGALSSAALPVPVRLLAAAALGLAPLWLGRSGFFRRPSAAIESGGGLMMAAMLLSSLDVLFSSEVNACALFLLVLFGQYALGGRRPKGSH